MCPRSASTSHAWGVCPSAPCAHLKSKRHVATAFAATHARKAPHRIRHACSNLFSRRKGCSRALTTSLQPRLPKRRGALDFLCPPVFFFFFFFFCAGLNAWSVDWKSGRCKVSTVHSQNWPAQVTYGSRPTCLKSRSTSWDGGHWPSAPLTPGKPSRDIATARATVQEIKDPPPKSPRLFRTLPQQRPQGTCLRTCQCAQKRLGLN